MKTMKTISLGSSVILSAVILVFQSCAPKGRTEAEIIAEKDSIFATTGGFASKVEWGEHLVNTLGCHDCHSPKKMTDHGPEPDPDMLLSGHHADFRPFEFDRSIVEKNGYTMTNEHFTAWAGVWGTSYTANITSDPTGIGNWTEENFFTAIRKGKFKGIESGRDLLPPMPWPVFAQLKDGELSAIFAYLKSTKPINNVVPAPLPPSNAAM